MAELFVSLGHERIGAILGPADTSTARDREAGFRAALDDAGMALPSRRVFRRDFDHESGRLGLQALLDVSDPPSAIFCANDFIAVGVLNVAVELGIKVPDDVAVVGFDDLDMAAWPVFGLTTVRNPVMQMARRAAGMLVDLVEGANGDEVREVVGTELVLRRTHGQ